MFLAVGHGHTIFEAEQPIDGDSVVERAAIVPAGPAVPPLTRNGRGAINACSSTMVMASLDERFGKAPVRAWPSLGNLRRWAGILGVGDRAQLEAQIPPRLPVIRHCRPPGFSLRRFRSSKDDAGIGPDGTGEGLVNKARGEQRH